MAIQFTKMSGSGNDFVIVDNRVPVIDEAIKLDFVKRVCARKTSVGADGVIFIENSEIADIKWDFYNDDGSSAEMCGNGARCAARYASEKGITSNELSLETLAGIITAKVDGANVTVKLTTPQNLQQDLDVGLEDSVYKIDHLNTGVPHAIIYSENVDDLDVQKVGRGIRFHEKFQPAGTNVDFVQSISEHELKIRTYERGVENETLACGTGVVASALLASKKNMVKSPVEVETRGGEKLKVHFVEDSNGSEVYLEGLTRIAFEGTLVEI